jgi:hypothetical protein
MNARDSNIDRVVTWCPSHCPIKNLLATNAGDHRNLRQRGLATFSHTTA